jgi:hypothetical protein
MDDDVGSTEYWRDIRAAGQKKRAENLQKSLAILKEHGIEFKTLSEIHLRIGDFDYWPSTGLFINLKTKRRGRGVFNLIRKLKGD